jgi:NarL family two-component system response regulator LiaR
MADERVTVLLGRFEPLISIGLTGVLRSDRQICVLASDLEGKALQREAKRKLPRVAIVDEAHELQLLTGLKADQPAIGVMVLAHRPSHEYGMRVLAAGASCLSRSATAGEILATVHLTAKGGRVFTAADGSRHRRSRPKRHRDLTGREREVLALIRAGQKNVDIARELQISINTVKSHVATIRRKLGVGSKWEC